MNNQKAIYIHKKSIYATIAILIGITCLIYCIFVYKSLNPEGTLKTVSGEIADNASGIDNVTDDSASGITDNTGDTPDTSQISDSITDLSAEYTSAKESDELRGVWISFFDYNIKGYTKTSFTNQIRKRFNNCVNNNFNTVFVHVRMFSDAMYNSDYFPWSQYSSGKIGKNPGFDPLAIMVEEAHKRNLKIHAWINPYRITKDTTRNSALAKNSYAYKWRNSKSPSLRRNVLNYDGRLYFNPSKPAVRNLITNGVKEIVKFYDVDGIHFDDYFYPNLGTSYKSNFDAKEYKTYVKNCKTNGNTPLSIINWRRNNVSKLIKQVYSAVKKINSDCIFGISPAGRMSNLYLKNSYYCDVKKWMGQSGYIDYICPQIYWSFNHSICPYKKTLNEWTNVKRHKTVKLYVGLAAYRAGISTKEAKAIGDKSWSKSNTILKREITYARNTDNVSGFIFFDYSDLERKSARKEINNAVKLFN